MLAHPNILAQFNSWANKRLYSACNELPESELNKDRKAFFRSIIGTFNHILLVDILYRERLLEIPTKFKKLDEILFKDFKLLYDNQMDEDDSWISITENIPDGSFDEKISFLTLLENPDRWEVPKHIYFTNLCQHQCHHRAQIHNMISASGVEPPPIGYIEFRIETDGSFVVSSDQKH